MAASLRRMLWNYILRKTKHFLCMNNSLERLQCEFITSPWRDHYSLCYSSALCLTTSTSNPSLFPPWKLIRRPPPHHLSHSAVDDFLLSLLPLHAVHVSAVESIPMCFNYLIIYLSSAVYYELSEGSLNPSDLFIFRVWHTVILQ